MLEAWFRRPRRSLHPTPGMQTDSSGARRVVATCSTSPGPLRHDEIIDFTAVLAGRNGQVWSDAAARPTQGDDVSVCPAAHIRGGRSLVTNAARGASQLHLAMAVRLGDTCLH